MSLRPQFALPWRRPRGVLSAEEFRRRHPSWWRPAIDATHVARRAPVVHGRAAIDFAACSGMFPPLGAMTIPHGGLLGAHAWPLTPRREFLKDSSWHGEDANRSLLPRALPKSRRLEGTCLSLGSDFAAGNYAHFLLDGLSRLEIFKRAGGDLAQVDHVALPRPPSRSALRIAIAMGIEPEKCVWIDAQTWLRPDVLVATSFPGLKRNYPSWLPRSLQRHVADTPRHHRRIYVPRTGTRRAANEDELIVIAAEFGFDVYDFTRCESEPEFFSGVDAVIGAHGAGLANLVFCRPGTRVLEMIPSDHVHPYFYTLADSAGLDYHCLVGSSLGSRPPNTFGPSPFDFVVDPAEFRAALVAMKF